MVACPALALWLSLQKWRTWGSSRVSGVTGKSGGGGPAYQRATMSSSARSRPALSFRRHGPDARRMTGAVARGFKVQVQRLGLGAAGTCARASRQASSKRSLTIARRWRLRTHSRARGRRLPAPWAAASARHRRQYSFDWGGVRDERW
jgi:hypothetical protein